MIAKPTLLRARITQALTPRYPRGMTPNQIFFLMGINLKALEMIEVLTAMVLDGLLVETTEPRPHPHAPLKAFAASPILVRGGRSR